MASKPTGETLRNMVIGGKYQLLRELGSGGSATVYLAREATNELGPDRLVAVKVMRDHTGYPESRLRFSHEIQVMARLVHPHIVPLLDTGSWEGRLFLVMPYIEGDSLATRIAREKHLPVADAITMALQLCDALQYAHNQRVVHRDVKPSNVLFTKSGHAMLADFGVARWTERAEDDRLTRSSVGAPGTVAYASPEQIAGERQVDARSDIYSLGMVLFEALTGNRPFADLDARSRLSQQLLGASVKAPLHLTSDGGLQRVIESLLAPHPDSRPATASEVARLLAACQPGLEQPKRNRQERWTASRTRRTALAASIAGALAVYASSEPREESVTTFGAALPRASAQTPIGVLAPSHAGDSVTRSALGSALEEAMRHFEPSPFQNVSINADDADALLRGTSSDEMCRQFRRSGLDLVVLPRFHWFGGSLRSSSVLVDLRTCVVRPAISATVGSRSAEAFDLRVVLAESLAPPGTPPDALSAAQSSRSLAALQAYWMGRSLLTESRLEEAMVAFRTAMTGEGVAAARVWHAVSAWIVSGSPRAMPSIQPAEPSKDVLLTYERNLLRAISALASGAHGTACAIFRGLTNVAEVKPLAFAGLAECQLADPSVNDVQDGRRPAYFVTSYEGAFADLQRAAMHSPEWLLPLIYSRARIAAPTAPAIRHGSGRTGRRLAALPEVLGDTLAFSPLPLETLRSSEVSSVPRSFAQAIDRARQLRLSLAQTLVQRFPRSSLAHLALAEALEGLGVLASEDATNVTALSELTQSRALDSDGLIHRQALLASVRVLIRLRRYEDARALADSVLSLDRIADAQHLAQLTSVSIFFGRLALAESLLAKSVLLQPLPLPVPGVVSAAYARSVVLSSSGRCGQQLDRADSAVLAGIAQAVVARLLPDSGQRALSRSRSLAVPCRGLSSALAILDTTSMLVQLQRALARQDTTQWRVLLQRARAERANGIAGFVSLDQVYQEAWLLAAAGDRAEAVAVIKTALAALPTSPSFSLDDPGVSGALPRLLELGSRLAVLAGNGQHAAQLDSVRRRIGW